MNFKRSKFFWFALLLGSLCFAKDYAGNEGPLSEISSIKQLSQFVDSHQKVKSIEDLLHALPEPLRETPVFIYQSRSLQQASFDYPRVLLSDPSGRLVLSFNGSPAQEGFHKIEAMEFDESTSKFRFYELAFNDQGRFQVSAPNPTKCLSCHRSPDPRPNWESYDQWPGVYGGSDDRLRNEEVEPFKTFLRKFEANPRYSALKIDSLRKVLDETSHFGRLPKEPNISFTHRLSQNNFKRISRLIMESSDYQNFKFVIGAYLSSKSGMGFRADNLVPDDFKGITQYYSRANIEEVVPIAISYADAFSHPGTLAFRSLFESRGIDTSDWFMNFKGGLSNTFVNGVSWEAQLLEALLERDPELKSLLYEGSTFQLDESKLTEASQEKFSHGGPTVSIKTYGSDLDVPKRIWRDSCRQCHERIGEVKIPQIDFEAAIHHPKFRDLIESGAMPKDQKLTTSQKKHLLNLVK